MARKSHAKHQGNSHRDTSERGTKESRRSSRRHRRSADVVEINPSQHHLDTAYATQRILQPLLARTPAQQRYISAIRNHCLTFGIGPAGTGKSYCAASLAAEALESGQIERIILTRPAVEAGEQLGFLPGAVDEKFAVYIEAFRDILNERLGAGQNTSIAQMKMFLTRIGENCKVVVNGDVKQSDIRGANGLADAVERLAGLSSVYVHEFERGDIVRSGLVRDIIDCYEPDELKRE